MINILMISDSLIKGGKERRILELLRFIDKTNKFKIEFIILKNVIDYPSIYDLKNTKLTVLKRRIKKRPFHLFGNVEKI